MVAIEEIFSYQFSFADIEADKYIAQNLGPVGCITNRFLIS